MGKHDGQKKRKKRRKERELGKRELGSCRKVPVLVAAQVFGESKGSLKENQHDESAQYVAFSRLILLLTGGLCLKMKSSSEEGNVGLTAVQRGTDSPKPATAAALWPGLPTLAYAG